MKTLENRILHSIRLPWWLSWLKNPRAKAGDARDAGSISGSGRSPGEGNGNPLQNSCLENSMDRGAWQATVRGAAKTLHCGREPESEQ